MISASHTARMIASANPTYRGRLIFRSCFSTTALDEKAAVTNVVDRRIVALEKKVRVNEEPAWKIPLEVKEGILERRLLRYLKQEPKEVFDPTLEERVLINSYNSQFDELAMSTMRQLFHSDVSQVKSRVGPWLGIEYARTKRFADRKMRVPPQDFRELVAKQSPILLNTANHKMSSPLWQVRFEALVDHGVVTGFKSLIADFDKIRKKFGGDLLEKPPPKGRFDPFYYMVSTPTLPTRESLEACQEFGVSPAVVVEAFAKSVGMAHSSLRDRLVGGFPGGSLNEIGLGMCRLLESNGLDLSSVLADEKDLFGDADIAALGIDVKSAKEADLDIIQQVRIGVALFKLMKKHLKICDEPLFVEIPKHLGCIKESVFFSKSVFDLQQFTLVTLNPKMACLLDELAVGDPPDAYYSLTEKNVDSFWMATPEGPRLFIKHADHPIDMKEVFMRADANVQVQSLAYGNYPDAIRGLNYLGSVKWQPNWDVIQSYENRMASRIAFGDIAPGTLEDSYETLVVSTGRLRTERIRNKVAGGGMMRKVETLTKDRESIMALKPATDAERWKSLCDGYLTKKVAKLVSDQASLNFARKYNAERSIEAAQVLGDNFTIPYNMDFRGRCYPIPKSLNPIGDDFSRGVLKFSKKVPLGPRGFFWLKVHLANQFGQDKETFDKRSEWVMANMGHILASVPQRDEPPKYYYSTNMFWTLSKTPIQAYAACVELASAMRHPDGPLAFPSNLPVQQDGSCNGLQHYAAIARDEVGGRSVNLTQSGQPADVYSEVVYEVKETIDRDAAEYQELGFNDDFLGTLFAEWERARQAFDERGDPVFDPVTGVMLQGRPDLDPNLLKDLDRLRQSKLGEILEKREEAASQGKGKRRGRREGIMSNIDKNAILENAESKAVRDDPYISKADLQKLIKDVRRNIDAVERVYLERREYDSVKKLMLILMELYTANAVQAVVNRNLVKQTVMTSVYGVTHLGAQRQILGRIMTAKDAGQIPLVRKEHVFFISKYLTALTIEATESLFESAFGVMAWLKQAGGTVTRFGQPLSWTTPLGLPVTQTYSLQDDESADDYGKLKRSKWTVGLSLGHEMEAVKSLRGRPELLAIHSQKQGSAFPPNFVHSLDSTHMLNTGIRCVEGGCDFAAVHDSFWCHASHVDYMSRVLREEFVKLHEKDLLKDLLVEWKQRYPFMETFRDLPERGTLNLRQVLNSPYFFS